LYPNETQNYSAFHSDKVFDTRKIYNNTIIRKRMGVDRKSQTIAGVEYTNYFC